MRVRAVAQTNRFNIPLCRAKVLAPLCPEPEFRMPSAVFNDGDTDNLGVLFVPSSRSTRVGSQFVDSRDIRGHWDLDGSRQHAP
jgi:hypothetical protein